MTPDSGVVGLGYVLAFVAGLCLVAGTLAVVGSVLLGLVERHGGRLVYVVSFAATWLVVLASERIFAPRSRG